MRILLAVDGSKHALAAGRSLARFSSVDELVILHVVDPARLFHPVLGFDMLAEFAGEMQKELRAEGERLLAGLEPQAKGWARQVRTRLESGAPADTILSVADEEGADLIVVGARGAGTLEELVIGSVSHGVTSRSTRPVLVVHDELRPVRRVLVPIVGVADAEAAARFLRLSPLPQPEEIRVLTVLPLVDPLWPLAPGARDETVRRGIAAGHRLVEEAAQKIARLGYRVRGVVTLGAPAPSILRAAAELPADLILMGARHRGAVTRFFLGSVSHGVLHGARVPVLVYRTAVGAGAEAEQAATSPNLTPTPTR